MLYDGELPVWRAWLLRAHVGICARCQDYLRQLESLSKAVGGAAHIEPAVDFTGRVMQAVGEDDAQAVLARAAHSLQAPGSLAGPEFTARVMEDVRRRPRYRAKYRAWAVAVTAAVGVLVIGCAIAFTGRPALREVGVRLRDVSMRVRQVARLLDPARLEMGHGATRLGELRRRALEAAGLEIEEYEGFEGRPRAVGREASAGEGGVQGEGRAWPEAGGREAGGAKSKSAHGHGSDER